MKTLLHSLLLSTPLLIAAVGCWAKFAAGGFHGLGWQDGN
jgi:hypothetical protein